MLLVLARVWPLQRARIFNRLQRVSSNNQYIQCRCMYNLCDAIIDYARAPLSDGRRRSGVFQPISAGANRVRTRCPRPRFRPRQCCLERLRHGAGSNSAESDPIAGPPRSRCRKSSRANCRERLDAHPDDLAIYEDSARYLVYERYYPDFGASKPDWRFYDRFAADWDHFFFRDSRRFESALHPAHIFACFRQVQDAFRHTFYSIIGNSMPAAHLRASVWQSVFTHDLRHYGRALFRKMPDFPTLITGPSGTGKELVARAIANFALRCLRTLRATRSPGPTSPGDTALIPINLAALSPALIESELFGHKRGSFTGAAGDRKGWLDSCPATGSIFLDELGELDRAIQVKLLRSAARNTALFRGRRYRSS